MGPTAVATIELRWARKESARILGHRELLLRVGETVHVPLDNSR